MANVGPTVWYLRDNAPTSTVGWSAVTAWAASTSVAAGALRRQLATPTVGNERVFVCTIAGTTGSTEPTWSTSKGGKNTDNTVTWVECTGQPAVNGDNTNSPTWLQNKNTTVSTGMVIINGAGTYVFICTTGGTTGNGSEPSWTLTAGATTADSGATWTCIGPASFGKWAAPHARLLNAYGSSWALTGSTIYIGDDHSETQAASLSLSFNGICQAICVDHTASLPPTSSNLMSTATIATSGNNALTLSNSVNYTCQVYIYGVIFSCGSGANAPQLNLQNGPFFCDTCSFRLMGTGSGQIFAPNIAGNYITTVLNNCTVQFNTTSGYISPKSGVLIWKNTASAILGSTFPTGLFYANSFASGALVILDGVDLSALSGKAILGSAGAQGCLITLTNCKLPSSITFSSSQGAANTVDVVNCDSAGTNYREARQNGYGLLTQELVVVRTNGSSNGTTSLSWKIATTTASLFWSPFECHPIGIWNPVTGSTVTCTLYGIWNGPSLPNNDDIWMDVEYMGSSGSPMASFASGSKANLLATGTAQTADTTSAWDSQATARANSTPYALTNTIKLASNPGRLFFCTIAGTTASSEPAGYASAVDTGAVTDGTAQFRAGTRFSMSVVLSSPQPQLAGDLYAIVRAARLSSTFYIDPLIVLS